MNAPAPGWVDPNPRDSDDLRAKRVLTVVAVALTLLVIAVMVVVVIVERTNVFDDATGQSVVLSAADSTPPDGFTPSAAVGGDSMVTDRVGASTDRVAAQMPYFADRGVRLAPGTQPGLYGATGSVGSCDPVAIANFLDMHPDNAAAWAQTLGLSAEQIPYYLNALTPVILMADTWVTSHSYTDGQAVPFQSVLQTGSAILIDAAGVPRVHCASGSPLLPPVDQSFAKLTQLEGTPWRGYSPKNVVAVAYSTVSQQTPRSAVTEFSVVDLATSQLVSRKAGGTINLGQPTALTGQLPDPVVMNVPPTLASPK